MRKNQGLSEAKRCLSGHDVDDASLEGLFAPAWPGLKLGLEVLESPREAAGASDLDEAREWRAALCVPPEALRQWALWAMAKTDLRNKFPKSGDNLGLWISKSLRTPPLSVGVSRENKLGEAQAMCAIMWMLTPLYECYDKGLVLKDGSVGRVRIHAIQRPGSPASAGRAGSGSFVRVSFGLDSRAGDQFENIRELRAATLSMLGALSRAGALDARGWIEEERSVDRAEGSGRGVYEVDHLNGFAMWWERSEIALASPAPAELGSFGPRL